MSKYSLKPSRPWLRRVRWDRVGVCVLALVLVSTTAFFLFVPMGPEKPLRSAAVEFSPSSLASLEASPAPDTLGEPEAPAALAGAPMPGQALPVLTIVRAAQDSEEASQATRPAEAQARLPELRAASSAPVAVMPSAIPIHSHASSNLILAFVKKWTVDAQQDPAGGIDPAILTAFAREWTQAAPKKTAQARPASGTAEKLAVAQSGKTGPAAGQVTGQALAEAAGKTAGQNPAQAAGAASGVDSGKTAVQEPGPVLEQAGTRGAARIVSPDAPEAAPLTAAELPATVVTPDGFLDIVDAPEAGQFLLAWINAGQEADEEPALEDGEEAPAEIELVQEFIQNGDTVGKILQNWLSSTEINQLTQACKGHFALNRIRQGQPYSVHYQGDEFLRFEYEIDNDSVLVVERSENGFTASRDKIDYDINLCRVEGQINSSLFGDMAKLGEGAALAATLVDVFSWEINFIKDLRGGDRFNLLVEKRYRQGEFKGYGRLLAAHFTNQGNLYEAYFFQDDHKSSGYFTPDGESVRRAFLKAPLSYSRISSGYSPRRLHPVLMTWKAHPAIDYAAPTGTPVKSVGSGTVSFKGYNKAAGNHIKIKHNNGYETMYLHLSRYASGLKAGSRVAQGQVIGFVGSTGYATGPHLDFRMKRNGQYVNPLKELSPRDTPVLKAERNRFRQLVEIYKGFMEEKIELAEYQPELLTSSLEDTVKILQKSPESSL